MGASIGIVQEMSYRVRYRVKGRREAKARLEQISWAKNLDHEKIPNFSDGESINGEPLNDFKSENMVDKIRPWGVLRKHVLIRRLPYRKRLTVRLENLI